MRRCCLQQPSLGSRIIAGKHQHSPWSDQTCQRFHHYRVEDTPSRMAPFWPGIGEHYIGAGKAPGRQFRQNLPDIIIPETNVLQILLIYAGRSIVATPLMNGSAPIKPASGLASASPARLFAAAKTNFQKDIDRGMRELVSQWSMPGSKRNGGRVSASRRCRVLAERATFAPPIETLVGRTRPDLPAPLRGPVIYLAADASLSTRSVASQLNDPGPASPATRPK